MKKFLLFIGKILILLFLLAFVLDYGYTKVYEMSNPRSKFQYFKSLSNQKIDYVFLGSSRVENSIVSLDIEEKTGKKVLNAGFQAAKMSDIYFLLKLIDSYKIKTDTVFIQIDYIFNIENGNSNVFQYEIMPFIRENKVTKEYYQSNFSDDKWIYYFPFYRYTDFDSKIGLREFTLNILNKETKIINNKGFTGLNGLMKNANCGLPKTIADDNEYFNKIKSFAKKKNINVIYYFSPMSLQLKNRDYITKLKQKIPNLLDFSSVVKADKMFENCTHLNHDGASFFTDYFITNVLNVKVE